MAWPKDYEQMGCASERTHLPSSAFEFVLKECRQLSPSLNERHGVPNSRRAHPAATAPTRNSRHHTFSAPGTGFFAAETAARNRPSAPSGDSDVRTTHWKSPPLVGIFAASPHVGKKRECVVGLAGL